MESRIVKSVKPIDWKKKQLIEKVLDNRRVIFLTNGEFTEDGFSGTVVHVEENDKLEVGTFFPTISIANAELFNGIIQLEG